MYQYIQTIDMTSLNLYYGVMVEMQIWYRNKQYFAITDIIITRDHCILSHYSIQFNSIEFNSIHDRSIPTIMDVDRKRYAADIAVNSFVCMDSRYVYV